MQNIFCGDNFRSQRQLLPLFGGNVVTLGHTVSEVGIVYCHSVENAAAGILSGCRIVEGCSGEHAPVI